MIIVDLIKELMFQQGKTIRDIAQETGLFYSTVENIVLKDITPTPEEAKAILWVLGIKLEDVLSVY